MSSVSLVSAVSHESSPVLQGMLHGRLITIDAEDRLEVSREIPAALRHLEATSPVPAQQPEPVQ